MVASATGMAVYEMQVFQASKANDHEFSIHPMAKAQVPKKRV
jgi:hypothetical protein